MVEDQGQIENGETKDLPWRKSEITAAIVHLYYMQGQSYDPATLPRSALARMLGRNRITIFRCIQDAQGALDLAVEMKKQLAQIMEARREREKIRKEKRRIVQDRVNKRRKEQRRLLREQRMAQRPGRLRKLSPSVLR